MVTSCYQDDKPKDPNRNVVGRRYYEWGKPENIGKPLPDMLELKMGNYSFFSNREEAESYMSTYRIERSLVHNPPGTWGWPIELRVPLAVLDKKLTVEEYTKQYHNLTAMQVQHDNPHLTFVLNPAFYHDDKFDLKNWETWRGSAWYAMKKNIFYYGAICEPQFDKDHNYYFCDYFSKDDNQSQKRYYWSNDPKNIDPLVKQPVIAQCSYQFKDCMINIGYDNSTDILILGLSDKSEVTDIGWQKNVFLYIDYMPKIIEFLNEWKVD